MLKVMGFVEQLLGEGKREVYVQLILKHCLNNLCVCLREGERERELLVTCEPS